MDQTLVVRFWLSICLCMPVKNIIFVKQNKHIMKHKLILILLIGIFTIGGSYAQNKKRVKKTILKGLVLDTENKPIKEVSVFVDGKNCKILSDDEGRFELKIKSNAKTITLFTPIQGATEIAYEGEEEMVFVLKTVKDIIQNAVEEAKGKENDVTRAAYIKAHNRNINNSKRKANKDTAKDVYHYRNIYEMIQGEVAGVTVSGSTVTIRGVKSLTLSNSPIFVVNGMIVNSVDDISPSQVKSISVLKGGASTAIYGSRGANGVIVITLKTAVDD